MLTDTHCHLDFESFDMDRDAVVEEAQSAGIVRMLNPGINLASSQEAIALTARYDIVFAAVGVHPNEAQSWSDGTKAWLSDQASSSKVVAIGEIGLDYYWDAAPRSLQQEILEEQLSLSMQLQLPVVLHVRNPKDGSNQAMLDLLITLEGWTNQLKAENNQLAERPGVLHAFSGRVADARRALEMNFLIGIGGVVTYKNAEMLRSVVKLLPEDRILIETDAPFLAPVPYRGKRNNPGYVRYSADKIAEIRGVLPEQIYLATTQNAKRCFDW